MWSIPAVRIALIYLAARAVSTGFLLLASAMSEQGSRFGRSPGLATLTLGWDAQWYALIALRGYPAEMPVNAAGDVTENAWAFMPVYPYLSGAVGWVFGSWGVGAFLVSLVAGYLCCLMLYRMMRGRIGASASLWSVVLFAMAPLSVLFQLGYAEALFMLWVLLGLALVQARRYGWLYLVIPLMGFTRPGVLAFALMLGLFGIWRWFSRRREPLSARESVHIVALGVWACVVGFSWQVLAGLATGRMDAYLATELSWRRGWIGGDGVFVPFDGWFRGAIFWFRSWGLGEFAGIVVAAGLIAGAAAILLYAPPLKRLGVEVRLWCASYLLYLLAVFFPQSSIFRLLFPLSPLWAAVAQPRSAVWRWAVLGLALVGQWWWIWNMYGLGNQYWQIP